MKSFVPLLFPTSALAGSVLWSGVFNSSDTVADFDDWSWSNQVGAYQWYIHGTGNTSEYLGLASDFKNPAASDSKGLRTSIDGTSFWEGQTMERTELIPQTTSDLGSGHLYYHFSLSTKKTNAPDSSFEHQIAFFESHFTELQYGTSGTADNTLRWNAGGDTQWSVQLEAGNWYNFAYDIDFSAQTVGLWASNGSDVLTEVVKPVSASASSNSADWHVGVLRLPGSGDNDDAEEDWFWSGVYVEEAPITTKIGDSSSGEESSASASESTSAAQTSTVQAATSKAAVAATTSATSATSATTTSEAAPTTQSAVTTTEASSTTTSPATTSSVTTSSVTSVPTVAPAETTSSSTLSTSTSTSTPTSTSSDLTSLPSPTTASELLTDVKALLKSLVSRDGAVHARDFPRWE